LWLDPSDVLAWTTLADAYEQLGHRLQLVDIYPKLMELCPTERTEYHRRLVMRLIEIGDAAAARREFVNLRQSAPDATRDDPLLEARLLHLENRPDEALAKVKMAASGDPNHLAALQLEGRILLSQEKPTEAMAALRRVVERDPYNAEAHYLLGQAYVCAGYVQRGEEHLVIHHRLKTSSIRLPRLKEYAATRPHDVAVLEEIAELCRILGMAEEARWWQQAARDARARQPEDERRS
jgi:tetratricopeptide (TPR) repeat protein